MKKAVAFFMIGTVIMLASCRQDRPEIVSDYAIFLSLLDENGFQYSEEKVDTDSYLSVDRKPIWIDDEIISVFEYESNAAMEEDAAGIDKDGCIISNQGRKTIIDWVSTPYFFKKDTLIISYVGKYERILDFLNKNYGNAFAGYMNMDK